MNLPRHILKPVEESIVGKVEPKAFTAAFKVAKPSEIEDLVLKPRGKVSLYPMGSETLELTHQLSMRLARYGTEKYGLETGSLDWCIYEPARNAMMYGRFDEKTPVHIGWDMNRDRANITVVNEGSRLFYPPYYAEKTLDETSLLSEEGMGHMGTRFLLKMSDGIRHDFLMPDQSRIESVMWVTSDEETLEYPFRSRIERVSQGKRSDIKEELRQVMLKSELENVKPPLMERCVVRTVCTHKEGSI